MPVGTKFKGVTLRDLVTSTLGERPQIKTDTIWGGYQKFMPLPLERSFGVLAKFVANKGLKGQKRYETAIIFYNMEFQENKDREHPTAIETFGKRVLGIWKTKQQVRYMNKPSLSNSPVKVVCNCPDFYFMWWYYNKRSNAFAGPDFDKYIRVRPPSGRPPKNPNKVPGMCKHLYELMRRLQMDKYVKS